MTPKTVMPRDATEWTVADLDLLPDDGLRYELLDGTLLVSPAPTRRHQRAVLELGAQLRDSCPPTMEVMVAPLDWRPDQRTSLQPDVLVLANRDLVDGRYVTVGEATGNESLTLERPYLVTIVPATLIA